MARVPLYKIAETEMIRRITAGEWAVGLRLPNEFELADAFGVSQGTMRRALITLEGMGLLQRKPGRGTEVCAPAPITAPSQAGGVGSMRLLDAQGRPPVFDVYRAHSMTRGADNAEIALFGCARLASLERLFRHQGMRAALEDVAIPEAQLPALDEDADPDLGALLADAGVPFARIDDHLAAAVTSMGQSVTLACDRHTALLVLTRTARDAAGNAVARQRLRLVAAGFGYGRPPEN